MIWCVVEIPCGNGIVFDLLTAAEKTCYLSVTLSTAALYNMHNAIPQGESHRVLSENQRIKLQR